MSEMDFVSSNLMVTSPSSGVGTARAMTANANSKRTNLKRQAQLESEANMPAGLFHTTNSSVEELPGMNGPISPSLRLMSPEGG